MITKNIPFPDPLRVNRGDTINRLKIAFKVRSDAALARALGVVPEAVGAARRRKIPANWIIKAVVSTGQSANYLLGIEASTDQKLGRTLNGLWPGAGSGLECFPVPPPRPSAEQRPLLDTAMLIEIITIIEKTLADKTLTLTPDKKALTIGLLYQHFRFQGVVDKATVEMFLSLAA